MKEGGLGDDTEEGDSNSSAGCRALKSSGPVRGPVVVESDSSSESIAESPSASKSSIEPRAESDVNAASDSTSDCNRNDGSRRVHRHQSGLLTSALATSAGLIFSPRPFIPGDVPVPEASDDSFSDSDRCVSPSLPMICNSSSSSSSLSSAGLKVIPEAPRMLAILASPPAPATRKPPPPPVAPPTVDDCAWPKMSGTESGVSYPTAGDDFRTRSS